VIETIFAPFSSFWLKSWKTFQDSKEKVSPDLN
jgi:hypothetical protein